MEFTYSKQEEIIINGRERGYFFISEDGSEIIYRGSGKKFGFKDNKEKRRAYLLVELIDKYHYLEKQIQMDADVLVEGKNAVIGLLVYRGRSPYIAIDITDKTADAAKKDLTELLKKASIVNARYAMLALPKNKIIADLLNPEAKINDIPIAD
jgi:hypothetical protein